MKKSMLKYFIKSANEVKAQTKGTQIVWQIYAGGCYILDTEEDNVFDVCESEIEAKSTVSGINEEMGFDSGCYYKPILIDKKSGKRITRENLKHYLIKP